MKQCYSQYFLLYLEYLINQIPLLFSIFLLYNKGFLKQKMKATQLFKIILKQHSIQSKSNLKTLFIIISLITILIQKILILIIQKSQQSTQFINSSIFLGIFIIGSILSCLYIGLIGIEILRCLNSKSNYGENVGKNIINKITLITTFLLQLFYIPTIFIGINLINNAVNSGQNSINIIAILSILFVSLSQLIITILHNLNVYSIKSNYIGGQIYINVLMICWINNLIFPFLLDKKWGLLGLQTLTFILVGWVIYSYPRIIKQFLKWYSIYLSCFISTQLSVIVLSFTQSTEVNLNLILLCILIGISIYLLLQKHYKNYILNYDTLNDQNILNSEIYFNLIDHHYQNIAFILLGHRQNCPNITSCICHETLYQQSNKISQLNQNLQSLKTRIENNSLTFILNSYEKMFVFKPLLQISKLKIQFEELNASLLLYCFILVIQQQKYIKAYLLLKYYQQRWKKLSLLFQVKVQILLDQIIYLKNVEKIKINQKDNLYEQYWSFHQKYEKFYSLIENSLDIVRQIWMSMLSTQPEELKIINLMKRFDSVDKNIAVTYHILIKISHKQINEINYLMSKYQSIVLNIVNDKYSVIKNKNLKQKSNRNNNKNSQQKALSKQKRIFSKTLNNIVLLISIEQKGKSLRGQIKYKNTLFKQVLQQKKTIKSINQLILPQIVNKHNQYLHDFLLSDQLSFNHSNIFLFLEENGVIQIINQYEIWTQIVILNNEILIAVFLNNQNIQKPLGIYIQNQQQEIIYYTKNLNDYLKSQQQLKQINLQKTSAFIQTNQSYSSFILQSTIYQTQKIGNINSGKYTVFNVKQSNINKINTFQQKSLPSMIRRLSSRSNQSKKFEINHQCEINSHNKSNIYNIQNIQHPQHNQKIVKLQKFYQNIIQTQNSKIVLGVNIYFIVISCLFTIVWITCYIFNDKYIDKVINLSHKVNSISQLISSVSQTITSLKLLIIKSYFDPSFINFSEALSNIQYFKTIALNNVSYIVSSINNMNMYHLNNDGNQYFSIQNPINSVMSGLIKQVTFIASAPFQSFAFSPIQSQNKIPFTNTISNFFEANYNAVHTIFLQLLYEKINFFQNEIVSQIQNYFQSEVFILSVIGFFLILLLTLLSIYIRKNDQQVRTQTLSILQNISLQQKSQKLTKINGLKQILLLFNVPKALPNNLVKEQTNLKQLMRENNSVLSSQQNIQQTNKQKQPKNQKTKVKIQVSDKHVEIGRLKIFNQNKFTSVYLRGILHFIPLLIYFLFLGISNYIFTNDIQQTFSLKNDLGWQRQFIAGTRQYLIQLGMYEQDFDMGTNNANLIDQAFVKMHELKKKYDLIDQKSHFIQTKNIFQNINICKNLHLLKKSKTIGVNLTYQQCTNKRFGQSLQKGFYQALVFYLDSSRQFSLQHTNPFKFTLEERYQILRNQKLFTIVYIQQYLRQMHQILYDNFRQDIRENINGFKRRIQIVGWIALMYWIVGSYSYYRFIKNRKKIQIKLVSAGLKLISIDYLLRSQTIIDKINKGETHYFYK